MQKKLLALLLSFSLLASLFAVVPVSVSAEGTETPATTTLINDDNAVTEGWYSDIETITAARQLANTTDSSYVANFYDAQGTCTKTMTTTFVKDFAELLDADYGHTDLYGSVIPEGTDRFDLIIDLGGKASVDTMAVYNKISTGTNALYRLRHFDFVAVENIGDVATAEALATYNVENDENATLSGETKVPTMRHVLKLAQPVTAKYIALRVYDWGTNASARFEFNAWGTKIIEPYVFNSNTKTSFADLQLDMTKSLADINRAEIYAYHYNSAGEIIKTGQCVKSDTYFTELTDCDANGRQGHANLNSGSGIPVYAKVTTTCPDCAYHDVVLDFNAYANVDTMVVYDGASTGNTNRLQDFDLYLVSDLSELATATPYATYTNEDPANITAPCQHVLKLNQTVEARYAVVRLRSFGTSTSATNNYARLEFCAFGEISSKPAFTSETIASYANEKYYDGIDVAKSIITDKNATLHHRAYQTNEETNLPEKVVDKVIPFVYKEGNDRADAFDNDYNSGTGHGNFEEISDSKGYLYNDLIVELDGAATISQFALINGTSNTEGKYWLRHFDLYIADSIEALDTATPVFTYNAGEGIPAKRHVGYFPKTITGKVVALRIYDVCANDSYPRIEFNVYGEYNTEHVHKYTETLPKYLKDKANCQAAATYWKYCSCGEVSAEEFVTVGEPDATVHFGGTATCKTLAKCEGCDTPYGAIDANNHVGTEINVPAKAATCTTAGYTAGKKYDCCGAETLKSTEIKALGHSYGAYAVTKKATTSANGTLTKKCARCSNASSIAIAKIKTIKLSTTEYTYSGKAKKPSVTVKDSKGTKLKKDIDYTVSYASGRKNVGKYKVTIKFKGNYSGSKTLYFTINPKKTSVKSISAGSKKLTVKWSKQKSQATGYEIQYSTSSKFTSKTTKKTTVKSYKTTSKTIKKLKAKKKYYVRIRTYKTVKGKKYYSAWSSKKYKTTKK